MARNAYKEKVMNISVVIPVYNTAANYLQECIESISNQTYKPLEIIIVNDGSTRLSTLEKLDEYRNKEGFIVIDQENKKISGALNTGIRNMKGDWWAGCSSDDKWYLNKLEEQVKFVEQNPEAKVIYGDWDMIDENGYLVRRNIEPEFNTLHDQQQYLLRGYFGTWSGMLVHKSVFEKVGLFDETFPSCEDYDMNIRISQYFMFQKVHKPLMMYRVHPEQLSNTEMGYGGEKGRYYNQKAIFKAQQLFGNNAPKEQIGGG